MTVQFKNKCLIEYCNLPLSNQRKINVAWSLNPKLVQQHNGSEWVKLFENSPDGIYRVIEEQSND